MTHLTFQTDQRNTESQRHVVRHGIRCCVAVSRNAAHKINNCIINAYKLSQHACIPNGPSLPTLKKLIYAIKLRTLTTCISVQCSSSVHNYRHGHRSFRTIMQLRTLHVRKRCLFGCISATIGGILAKLHPCTFNACATNNVSLVTISKDTSL